MRYTKTSTVLSLVLIMIAMTVTLAPRAQASGSEQILYSFSKGADGGLPLAGLVMDGAGNLYGTTWVGGTSGYGVVFELSPGAGGDWTQTVLHSFTGGKDGGLPLAGLIIDGAGNLYGTTQQGGSKGHGTAFEMIPGAGGKWKEKVLHSFGRKDGSDPAAALIMDAAGNLYGTAPEGGSKEYGAVFMLMPPVKGSTKWTVKTLHSFNNNQKDGYAPLASLVMDASGNLYGTASQGGKNGAGVVFQMTPNGDGTWSEQIIHSFDSGNGKDGSLSTSGLLLDAAGNLYGTTEDGGKDRFYGVAFELTPDVGGKWNETILRTFDDGKGGGEPNASLIMDANGNLYGTTTTGGNAGVAFELTQGANGKWKETVLHTFKHGKDGAAPYAGLVFDSKGNLYGTTKLGGGTADSGTVFEITP